MVEKLYSTYVRIGITSIILGLIILLLMSPEKMKTKRIVQLSTLFVTMEAMVLFVWELYGIPWKIFVILISVNVTHLMVTISYIVYILIESLQSNILENTSNRRRKTSQSTSKMRQLESSKNWPVSPTREARGQTIVGRNSTRDSLHQSSHMTRVSMSKFSSVMKSRLPKISSTSASLVGVCSFLAVYILGIFFFSLILIMRNENDWANYILLTHATLALVLSILATRLFWRFRNVVDNSIEVYEPRSKYSKHFLKRLKNLQKVRLRISQLMYLSIIVGPSFTVVAYIRAISDLIISNHQRFDEHYMRAYGDSKWRPLWDLLLYAIPALTCFALYWAWAPIRPCHERLAATRTSKGIDASKGCMRTPHSDMETKGTRRKRLDTPMLGKRPRSQGAKGSIGKHKETPNIALFKSGIISKCHSRKNSFDNSSVPASKSHLPGGHYVSPNGRMSLETKVTSTPPRNSFLDSSEHGSPKQNARFLHRPATGSDDHSPSPVAVATIEPILGIQPKGDPVDPLQTPLGSFKARVRSSAHTSRGASPVGRKEAAYILDL
ncbi:hypothetical protein AAMO2058_000875300 [Amorphochlora amoebiformis]